MSKVKISKAGFEKRVFTVQGWLIDAVPDYLILKQIQDQWNISLRQARRYLREAYSRWNTESEATIEDKRQTHIAWLQNEIRTMDPKYKNTPLGKNTLLRYAKELSRLESLYPAKHVKISGDSDQPITVQTKIEAIEIVRVGT